METILNNTNPLVLVFYLDREMMNNPEIISPFADAVNDVLAQKNANAIAFFLPTDGDERIEAINPTQVEKADMDKVNKLIEDIANNFDIGKGADEGKNDSSNNITPNDE